MITSKQAYTSSELALSAKDFETGGLLYSSQESIEGKAREMVLKIEQEAMSSFEEHSGPLLLGDLIVIECKGKIIPRRQNDPRPQWFVVTGISNNKDVTLRPFNDPTSLHKAKKYIVQNYGNG